MIQTAHGLAVFAEIQEAIDLRRSMIEEFELLTFQAILWGKEAIFQEMC